MPETPLVLMLASRCDWKLENCGWWMNWSMKVGYLGGSGMLFDSFMFYMAREALSIRRPSNW